MYTCKRGILVGRVFYVIDSSVEERNPCLLSLACEIYVRDNVFLFSFLSFFSCFGFTLADLSVSYSPMFLFSRLRKCKQDIAASTTTHLHGPYINLTRLEAFIHIVNAVQRIRKKKRNCQKVPLYFYTN